MSPAVALKHEGEPYTPSEQADDIWITWLAQDLLRGNIDPETLLRLADAT